jgi:hypothetical protein
MFSVPFAFSRYPAADRLNVSLNTNHLHVIAGVPGVIAQSIVSGTSAGLQPGRQSRSN